MASPDQFLGEDSPETTATLRESKNHEYAHSSDVRDAELATRDAELATRDAELATRDAMIKSILLKLSPK